MMNNPLHKAVADVNERLAGLDAETLATVEESATLSSAEWLALGDKSTRAMIEGIIDQDTANLLHVWHTDFNSTATLAQRVVFMQAMGEILARLK